MSITAQEINQGIQMGASDVHITVLRPRMCRVKSRILSLPGTQAFTSDDTRKFC